jgi:hypothetical protein
MERDAAANPAAKIHPSLRGARPAAKVHVKVYLSANTAQAVEELKRLGLVVERHDLKGGFVTGHLEAARLEALAKSTLVRYVSPAI